MSDPPDSALSSFIFLKELQRLKFFCYAADKRRVLQ